MIISDIIMIVLGVLYAIIAFAGCFLFYIYEKICFEGEVLEVNKEGSTVKFVKNGNEQIKHVKEYYPVGVTIPIVQFGIDSNILVIGKDFLRNVGVGGVCSLVTCICYLPLSFGGISTIFDFFFYLLAGISVFIGFAAKGYISDIIKDGEFIKKATYNSSEELETTDEILYSPVFSYQKNGDSKIIKNVKYISLTKDSRIVSRGYDIIYAEKTHHLMYNTDVKLYKGIGRVFIAGYVLFLIIAIFV